MRWSRKRSTVSPFGDRWPTLSPDELQRLTSLPIWDIAIQTEGRARLSFAAYANSLDDAEIRSAVMLNAWEEGREKEVLSHMVRVDGMLYLNPGSAGPRRFTLPVALAMLELTGKCDPARPPRREQPRRCLIEARLFRASNKAAKNARFRRRRRALAQAAFAPQLRHSFLWYCPPTFGAKMAHGYLFRRGDALNDALSSREGS